MDNKYAPAQNGLTGTRPVKILACESGDALANSIYLELHNKYAEQGRPHMVEQVPVNRTHFADGDMKNYLAETVSGASVYIVQSIHDPDSGRNPQTNFESLLDLIGAARHAVRLHGTVSVIMPDYYGARQDKRAMRESIKAARVARQLEDAGANCVLSMDVHNTATAGYFDILNTRFENLRADRIFMEYLCSEYNDVLSAKLPVQPGSSAAMSELIKCLESEIEGMRAGQHTESLSTTGIILSRVKSLDSMLKSVQSHCIDAGEIPRAAFASLDAGGAKRAEHYAKTLNTGLVIGLKNRDQAGKIDELRCYGNVSGRDIFVVDDIVDTFGTGSNGLRSIKDQGAKSIIYIATHPWFSGNAPSIIEELHAEGVLDRMIVTDTVMHRNYPECVQVVSVAPTFAEVIYRLENQLSISDLLSKPFRMQDPA